MLRKKNIQDFDWSKNISVPVILCLDIASLDSHETIVPLQAWLSFFKKQYFWLFSTFGGELHPVLLKISPWATAQGISILPSGQNDGPSLYKQLWVWGCFADGSYSALPQGGIPNCCLSKWTGHTWLWQDQVDFKPQSWVSPCPNTGILAVHRRGTQAYLAGLGFLAEQQEGFSLFLCVPGTWCVSNWFPASESSSSFILYQH